MPHAEIIAILLHGVPSALASYSSTVLEGTTPPPPLLLSLPSTYPRPTNRLSSAQYSSRVLRCKCSLLLRQPDTSAALSSSGADCCDCTQRKGRGAASITMPPRSWYIGQQRQRRLLRRTAGLSLIALNTVSFTMGSSFFCESRYRASRCELTSYTRSSV